MRSAVSVFKNLPSHDRGQAAVAWGVLCWKLSCAIPEEQAERSLAGAKLLSAQEAEATLALAVLPSPYGVFCTFAGTSRALKISCLQSRD